MRGARLSTTASASLAVAWLFACGAPSITGPNDDDIDLPPRDDEPDEEEDAGTSPALRDATPSREADAPSGLRVFITSTTKTGNLGGRAGAAAGGADAECAARAAAARLGGSWVAWLSVEDGPHAVERVTSAGPWRLLSGELVAASKTALVSGTLAHAIDRDETGAPRSGQPVWTGSGANGRYDERDCDRWTTGDEGRVGNSSATNAGWTNAGADGCGNPRRLYCFEK